MRSAGPNFASSQESEATKAFYTNENQNTQSTLPQNDAERNYTISSNDEQADLQSLKELLNSLPTPPPHGWERVKFEAFINDIQTAKRPNGGVGNYTSGVLSLGGEHIDNTSGYVKLDTPKYVPYEFYEQYKKQDKGIVKKNDILICKDGALTGKIALVRDEFENKEAMINEHIFLIRCDELSKQKFLFYFLHSFEGQNILKAKITGSAQGGLNQENLKSIKIPLPPLKAQEKIASVIDFIEAKISQLETKKENLESQKEGILLKYLG